MTTTLLCLTEVRMNFITCLAILTVIVAGASTTNAVTNSTQDYYLSTRRKLNNDIADAEKRIAAVTEQANAQIKVFEQQHEIVLQEMKRTEERFTTLETISSTRKRCVQEYKYQLVSVSTASSQFTTCIATSKKRISTLTDESKPYINDAKANTNTRLPNYITDCNNKNSNNQTQLEACVIYGCDYYSKSVETNLKSVDKSLDASSCSVNDINKDEIKCSFVTENNVLVTIGTVTSSINNCIFESEKPPCCSCTTPTPRPCPTPSPCPTTSPCPTPTIGPSPTAVPCTTALPASNSTVNGSSFRSILMGARI